MYKTGIIGLLMFVSVAHAEHRIAVIDSGYNGKTAKVCAFGSYDLVKGEYGTGHDSIGHGTKVANTIAKGNSNYCLVVLRIFSGEKTGGNLVPAAIFRAITEHVEAINLSLEGWSYDPVEYVALKYAVSKGIKIYVASGNDHENLDLTCDIYPACYRIPGVTVVGTFEQGKADNTGSVVTQQEAWCSEGACGTSLSTAIATQKYLKGLK